MQAEAMMSPLDLTSPTPSLLQTLCVDIDLLPEAVMASESSQVKAHFFTDRVEEDFETFKGFLFRNLHQRPDQPSEDAARQAIPYIERLHPIVDYFARRLAREALRRGPMNRTDQTPSPTELSRFMRVLYRFETYCNLYREPDRETAPTEGKQSAMQELHEGLFLCKFSPWENEQLACIRDLLVSTLTPAYDEVARQDITLGFRKVAWGEEETLNRCGVNGLLAGGLEKMYRFVTAMTYEEREAVLFRDSKYPLQYVFVNEACAVLRAVLDLYRWEEVQDWPSHYADPDRGPRTTWLFMLIHIYTGLGARERGYGEEDVILRRHLRECHPEVFKVEADEKKGEDENNKDEDDEEEYHMSRVACPGEPSRTCTLFRRMRRACNVVNGPANNGRRLCAYVMWDSERLRWDVMQGLLDVRSKAPRLHGPAGREFVADMEASWARRADGYRLGGRGRYTPEMHEELRRESERREGVSAEEE